MILTHREAQQRNIPAWDEANPGQRCYVPCWPKDLKGNTADCLMETVLVGVLGDMETIEFFGHQQNSPIFRAEEAPAFHPGIFMWECQNCLLQPAHPPAGRTQEGTSG